MEQTESVPEKSSGGLKKILVITLLLVVAVGAAVGATVFLTGSRAPVGEAAAVESAADVVSEPPLYLSIDPPLVVNFERANRVSYLQVGIDVMSRDQAALDRVQSNMPVVRNNLILLFSGQSYDDLSTSAGKQVLREDVLRTVRAVVADTGGAAEAVEQVYFTSFVMQ